MLTRSIQDFISNSKINRNWSQNPSKSIEISKTFDFYFRLRCCFEKLFLTGIYISHCIIFTLLELIFTSSLFFSLNILIKFIFSNIQSTISWRYYEQQDTYILRRRNCNAVYRSFYITAVQPSILSRQLRRQYIFA